MANIRLWWQQMSPTQRLVIIILGVGAAVSTIVGLLMGETISSFMVNLGSELGGALATFLILDQYLGRREKRDAEEREKQTQRVDRIKRMGSEINNVALRAIEEFKDTRELFNGALQGISITEADLSHSNLQGANLEGIRGMKSKFIAAKLQRVNFKGAFLVAAYLQDADLHDADLQGATLSGSDLSGANLKGANLEKVIIGYTIAGIDNSKDLHIETIFDERTILPDGYPWTPETDLSRFTSTNHPDFWRSDNPHSPAFRGSTPS